MLFPYYIVRFKCIPSNSVANNYSNKNFPANKNINNNIKNFSNNNKNFSNNKNLKNISQINYPNLKGWAKFKVSVKIFTSVKFSIKFNNAKFPYYIVIIKFIIKFINAKFPYYIKFITINYIKINNVIGVRQLRSNVTAWQTINIVRFQGANAIISFTG